MTSNGNGLTDKQKAFIDEYFVDFNGTQAAKRAGYAGNENTLASVASENLRKPKIAVHIAERFQARCMTADECLWRLGEQARGDIGDFVSEHGGFDLVGAKKAGLTRLLKSIAWTKVGVTVQMESPQKALELIGKAHGLFKERYEHSGPDGGPITHLIRPDLSEISDEELDRLGAIARRFCGDSGGKEET